MCNFSESDYQYFEDSFEESGESIPTSPSSNDSLGCILPETPSNGRYAVINQPGAVVPGHVVATSSLLLYTCDEGYSNSLGELFSECRHDGTWSSAPECKSKIDLTLSFPRWQLTLHTFLNIIPNLTLP